MADNKVNSGLLEFSEDQKVFVALDAETSEVKKAVTIDEDGVETDMLGVVGSYEPEAPASDFSTAAVTLVNAGLNILTGAFVVDDTENNVIGTMGESLPGATSLIFVLYKGKAYFRTNQTVTLSGNITYDTDLELYIVTGDGTVTFTGSN